MRRKSSETNSFLNRFYRVLIFPGILLYLITGYLALTSPVQPAVEPGFSGYALWARITGAFVAAPVAIALGWMVTRREKQNLIGPAIILWGCATNAELGLGYLPPFWAALSGFYLGAIANPALFLMVASFPTGFGVTPFWNRVIKGVTLILVGLSIFRLFSSPYPYGLISPNPFAVEILLPINPILTRVTDFLLIGFMFLAIFLGFYRYHIINETERKQMRWLLLVGLYYALFAVIGFSLNWGANLGDFGVFLFSVLAIIAFVLPSITISIAILFHQLWDIDIIIRRTLQYSLLTGMLALVYFSLVLILQNLVSAFSSQQSAITIVLSTLVIAALFNPLRMRLQDFIDRRFYRRKYDAEQALADFASTTRDEVEMDKLTAALLEVVEETMQPEQVFLWLQLPTYQNRNGGNHV